MPRRNLALWCAMMLSFTCAAAEPASPTNVPPAVVPPVAAAPSANANAELLAKVKELAQKQHDLEYSDPELSRTRQQIVDLEKQLIEKRRELALQLERKPEVKKLQEERLELVRKMQQAVVAPVAAP